MPRFGHRYGCSFHKITEKFATRGAAQVLPKLAFVKYIVREQ